MEHHSFKRSIRSIQRSATCCLALHSNTRVQAFACSVHAVQKKTKNVFFRIFSPSHLVSHELALRPQDFFQPRIGVSSIPGSQAFQIASGFHTKSIRRCCFCCCMHQPPQTPALQAPVCRLACLLLPALGRKQGPSNGTSGTSIGWVLAEKSKTLLLSSVLTIEDRPSTQPLRRRAMPEQPHTPSASHTAPLSSAVLVGSMWAQTPDFACVGICLPSLTNEVSLWLLRCLTIRLWGSRFRPTAGAPPVWHRP